MTQCTTIQGHPYSFPGISLCMLLVFGVLTVLFPVRKNIPNGGFLFTLMNIVCIIPIMPHVIETLPFLAEPKWQLVIALCVTVLDWVSLLEDKSRFSENLV